jgi:hypothetical protein
VDLPAAQHLPDTHDESHRLEVREGIALEDVGVLTNDGRQAQGYLGRATNDGLLVLVAGYRAQVLVRGGELQLNPPAAHPCNYGFRFRRLLCSTTPTSPPNRPPHKYYACELLLL